MRRKLLLAAIPLALAAIAATGWYLHSRTPDPLTGGTLANFTSYEELVRFVGIRPSRSYTEQERYGKLWSLTEQSRKNVADASVYGVSELADVVKADGEYIYLAGEDKLTIVLAQPAEESRIVAQLRLPGYSMGIFISGLYVTGDRLAVLQTGHSSDIYGGPVRQLSPGGLLSRFLRALSGGGGVSSMSMLAPGYDSPPPEAAITVYDITNRARPVQLRQVRVNAGLQTSRLTNGYIYALLTSPVRGPWPDGREVSLPAISEGGQTYQVPAGSILHPDVPDHYGTFATVLALNLLDEREPPAYQTFLTGYSNRIYLSPEDLYFTYGIYGHGMEHTSVHRFRLAEASLEHDGSGETPGRLMGLSPIDEHDGFLHLITGVGRHNKDERANLFVLDGALSIVGGIEDFASEGYVNTSLFAGDRAYLSRSDEAYVIDLTDPYRPAVLGVMDLPSFSGYALSLDRTRIVGVGRAADDYRLESAEWGQGIQVSLFAVDDVSAPRQIAGYDLGDRGSKLTSANDSSWLYFDPARGLLVVPLTLAEIDPAKYPQGISPSVDGQPTWQGAYVFDVSPEGLAIRGRVTHETDPERLGTRNTTHQYQTEVRRSLVIGDALYTISRLRIKVNDLATLEELWEVDLGARFPTG